MTDLGQTPRRAAGGLASGACVATLAVLIACGEHRSASVPPKTDSTATPVAAQWHDASPHQIGYVTVPGGIKIEVLDWGGQGEPLVFLAGLGDAAHVFDDFAPRFTDRFHVLGITRRGWGASDRPPAGTYTMTNLVQDDLAVLDSLHLGRVNLVGHSIAGQELTWLAADYPQQVDRVLYLDAAFDYHRHGVPNGFPDQPPPTAADSASPAAGFRYFVRMNGASLPESDYRATETITPLGRDMGPATPPSISAELVKSAHSADAPFERVRAPIIAIYNKPMSISEMIPWMTSSDSAAPRLFEMATKWQHTQHVEFARRVPKATVVELQGATHYLFLVKSDSVAALMRAFLSAP